MYKGKLAHITQSNTIWQLKKIGILSFARRWMELEIIVLSEISHTQKEKHHVKGRERWRELNQ